MGNAPLPNHGNLVYFRGWNTDQISAVTETVRRKSNLLRLTKEDYARYFGGRSREALVVFNDLDTDADGFVDVFEVLTVLIMWSGTGWDEKPDLLFSLFDLMGKGFLKVDELLMMGTIIIQAAGKFVQVDHEMQRHSTLQQLAAQAMPSSDAAFTIDKFKEWVCGCEPMNKLRSFIEDHAARRKPETAASKKRQRILVVERHTSKLYERISALQDLVPDFTDACVEYVSALGRRKRWDFLMQNLRQLIWKLQEVSTRMHTTLVDLDAVVSEEEKSGGTIALVDPRKRFQQERMLQDLETMRQESLVDYSEVTDLLDRLVMVTEPANEASYAIPSAENLNVINEVEGESMLDVSPPRVTENREAMRQVHVRMQSDTQEGGCFFRKVMEEVVPTDGPAAEKAVADVRGIFQKTKEDIIMNSKAGQDRPASSGQVPAQLPSQGAPAAAANMNHQHPILTVIAAFEPPHTHTAQLLQLELGEKITVMGQDGRGWWYGRKENGREGWFPPSYVQLHPAHFSSGPPGSS